MPSNFFLTFFLATQTLKPDIQNCLLSYITQALIESFFPRPSERVAYVVFVVAVVVVVIHIQNNVVYDVKINANCEI